MGEHADVVSKVRREEAMKTLDEVNREESERVLKQRVWEWATKTGIRIHYDHTGARCVFCGTAASFTLRDGIWWTHTETCLGVVLADHVLGKRPIAPPLDDASGGSA